VQDFKISLITVTFNAESTISRCIESVTGQTFKNFEYIIIDGSSTDNTKNIIEKNISHIDTFVSEPDKGIYDAINKGIALASGNIIGILNADDFFANKYVLELINEIFNKRGADIVYGDLDYINNSGKVIRKWRSGDYKPKKLKWGWMPPHPTFYCRRDLYQQKGAYSLDYGTAADYELILRFLNRGNLKVCYINEVLIKMQIGGASNKSFNNRVKGLFFDLKAMKHNQLKAPLITLICKPLRKVLQYF
jgi:glycosyltransferase involved in cell wall biosynthesis